MAKNKEMLGIFFKEKPVNILLNLHNKETGVNFGSKISKEIDCTYSHCVKLLMKYEKAGYVSFKRTGRIKEIKLSQKGKDFCILIEKVQNIL